MKWSSWKKFPDPRNKGFLYAPFGPGIYEIKNSKTNKYVLVGIGTNCAHRMSSLVLKKFGGCGTRNNTEKREYISNNISSLKYRTHACKDKIEASVIERRRLDSIDYLYGT